MNARILAMGESQLKSNVRPFNGSTDVIEWIVSFLSTIGSLSFVGDDASTYLNLLLSTGIRPFLVGDATLCLDVSACVDEKYMLEYHHLLLQIGERTRVPLNDDACATGLEILTRLAASFGGSLAARRRELRNRITKFAYRKNESPVDCFRRLNILWSQIMMYPSPHELATEAALCGQVMDTMSRSTKQEFLYSLLTACQFNYPDDKLTIAVCMRAANHAARVYSFPSSQNHSLRVVHDKKASVSKPNTQSDSRLAELEKKFATMEHEVKVQQGQIRTLLSRLHELGVCQDSNSNQSQMLCYRCWKHGHTAAKCKAAQPLPRPDHIADPRKRYRKTESASLSYLAARPSLCNSGAVSNLSENINADLFEDTAGFSSSSDENMPALCPPTLESSSSGSCYGVGNVGYCFDPFNSPPVEEALVLSPEHSRSREPAVSTSPSPQLDLDLLSERVCSVPLVGPSTDAPYLSFSACLANSPALEPLNILLDTGASTNYINEATAEALGLTPCKETRRIILQEAVSVTQARDYAQVTLPLKFFSSEQGSSIFSVTAVVIPSLAHPLIFGLGALCQAGAIIDLAAKMLHLRESATGAKEQVCSLQHKFKLPAPPLSPVEITRESVVSSLSPEEIMARISAEVEEAFSQMKFGPLADSELRDRVHSVLHDSPGLVSSTHRLLNPTTPPMLHHIPLKPDAQPVFSRPYPVPFSRRVQARKILDEWLSQGICKRVSNSQWASPFFLIQKSNGDWRGVVDYRQLNQRTVDVKAPMATAQSIFDKRHGTTVHSKLDMSKAYLDVKIAEDSQPCTAFIYEDAVYVMLRMCLGLKGAPFTYQILMVNSLREAEAEATDAYLDDLLTSSADLPSHVKDVVRALHGATLAGARLKPSKCFFGFSELP